MAELSFRNISKSYGDVEVVAGFKLEQTVRKLQDLTPGGKEFWPLSRNRPSGAT
jgi:hypothetical protein